MARLVFYLYFVGICLTQSQNIMGRYYLSSGISKHKLYYITKKTPIVFGFNQQLRMRLKMHYLDGSERALVQIGPFYFFLSFDDKISMIKFQFWFRIAIIFWCGPSWCFFRILGSNFFKMKGKMIIIISYIREADPI